MARNGPLPGGGCHHPLPTGEGIRRFALDIRIPDRIVCRGVIGFGLDHGSIGRSIGGLSFGTLLERS
jgi:hypothetical protein